MGKAYNHLKFRGNTLIFRVLPVLLLLVPVMLSAQMIVTITKMNVSCLGGNNGSATATATGGAGPYTYSWNTGSTSNTITGLVAGTYSVTATASNQSTAVGSVTITQPATQIGVTVYGENQVCGLVPDGMATAVPYDGTPPYTYIWSNAGTTPQIMGLVAGTYTVTVADANGCTASGSYTVQFWNEGIWLMDSTVDVSCFGLNNGFAHISAMTGTPPYTYLWSTGDSTEDVFNLPAGTYGVTVTDASGCENYIEVTIGEPDPLTCQPSSAPGACGLAGSATVAPAGGTAPYSVLWSTNSTNFSISALPGTYTVTVTDANDCECISQVTIGSTTDDPVVQITVNSNAGCTIGGDATASASGGSGNYSYSWDNGQITPTANNLMAGNHTVTVTDLATGCTGNATGNIPAAPQLEASTILESNATCLIGGSATAVATGGTPPLSYVWDNGQLTATATNLGAGPHTVTITDSKGCIVTAVVNIGQNQGPTVTATVVSNATCTTGGSATANATGGAGGYIYLWDNTQSTPTATNLSPGPHSVTVTDAAGCSAAAAVTITQTGALTISFINVVNAGCNGTGGSATAQASGGIAPYSYLWSVNNANTPTVNNLGSGVYTVTATDAAGCSATASVTIGTVVPPSVVIVAVVNETCNQPGSATASVTNGSGSYTYLWDNNETAATANNLTAGPHSVTVTDTGNGCTATASTTIGFTNNGGIKVGDYVWFDDDQNGVQHLLESGAPNIFVHLITAGPDGLFNTTDDITVQKDTTNAAGNYTFECVTPGTYILHFSGLPPGYEFADKDKVNDDCVDSDVNSNGKTVPFTISAGQLDNLCIDAGIHIFCDNVWSAGAICCDQTICEGETPALLYNALFPTGGIGNIEYQWMQLVQMGPAPPTWVAIPGATGIDHQPGPLTKTSYFMRCARREGCITFYETNILTITVLAPGSAGCSDFTMDITAKIVGKSNVLVEWSTSLPETDQFLYVTEHSNNLVDWHDFSTVMGQHDATKPNRYSVFHQTPNGGMNHYRVKRIDATGVSSFSPIRSLKLEIALAASVDIYPNPASSILIIKNVVKYDNEVTVQLINTTGDVLHTLTIPQGALSYEELPIGDLPSGIYMARVQFGNGEVTTYKISKI
ncbi:MAG: T9SS type A sorting domain-containing protein [Lewinellaceae bacterium]|nr:T9SS type A sorting domain-containing protein [Lewinellaceae bacterium]